MGDKNRLDFLEKENDHLKNLMLQHLSEIVTLKNENQYLMQEIAKCHVGEQEKQLVLLAKSIIHKLDPLGDIS